MELHELTQLSTQDRLQAMELLWQSFTEQQSGDLIPPWHQQVLDDRMARMQAGTEKTTPWQSAKDRLRDAIYYLLQSDVVTVVAVLDTRRAPVWTRARLGSNS